jgi:hypothetical protein
MQLLCQASIREQQPCGMSTMHPKTAQHKFQLAAVNIFSMALDATIAVVLCLRCWSCQLAALGWLPCRSLQHSAPKGLEVAVQHSLTLMCFGARCCVRAC